MNLSPATAPAPAAEQTAPKAARNYGIDALRILSMFMVVLLHVLGQGGVLYNVSASPLNNDLAWLLEAAAFCAVDCYALISGYVGVGSKFKLSNLLVLWLQVAFYSIGITAVMQNFFPAYQGSITLSQSFFPIMQKHWWYFTCYVGLFFLTPFLNRMIDALDRKTARNFCLTVLIVFSAFHILSAKNMFVLTNGYTVLWLILLYIIGGCFKRHAFFSTLPKILPFLAYIASIAVAWGTKMVLDGVENTEALPAFAQKSNFLINYTAPTIFIAAISLFVLFSNFKRIPTPITWLIRLFSPLAFSVYIIHTHPSIWQTLLKGRFNRLALLEPHDMVLRILGTVAVIFLVCAAIDLVRHGLFSLLRIKKIANTLEMRLKEAYRARKTRSESVR